MKHQFVGETWKKGGKKVKGALDGAPFMN